MKIDRLLINVCSANLQESNQFYVSLFDLTQAFSSDWFIQLVSEDGRFELGIIDAQHEIVPAVARGNSAGAYLTFVVADVDAVFAQARESGCDILQEPELTFYGQKRMLLRAPEGTVCDVSSPASG